LSGTLPFSGGQTIGKKLMGIKLLHSNNADIEQVIGNESLIRVTPKPLGFLRYAMK